MTSTNAEDSYNEIKTDTSETIQEGQSSLNGNSDNIHDNIDTSQAQQDGIRPDTQIENQEENLPDPSHDQEKQPVRQRVVRPPPEYYERQRREWAEEDASTINNVATLSHLDEMGRLIKDYGEYKVNSEQVKTFNYLITKGYKVVHGFDHNKLVLSTTNSTSDKIIDTFFKITPSGRVEFVKTETIERSPRTTLSLVFARVVKTSINKPAIVSYSLSQRFPTYTLYRFGNPEQHVYDIPEFKDDILMTHTKSRSPVPQHFIELGAFAKDLGIFFRTNMPFIHCPAPSDVDISMTSKDMKLPLLANYVPFDVTRNRNLYAAAHSESISALYKDFKIRAMLVSQKDNKVSISWNGSEQDDVVKVIQSENFDVETSASWSTLRRENRVEMLTSALVEMIKSRYLKTGVYHMPYTKFRTTLAEYLAMAMATAHDAGLWYEKTVKVKNKHGKEVTKVMAAINNEKALRDHLSPLVRGYIGDAYLKDSIIDAFYGIMGSSGSFEEGVHPLHNNRSITIKICKVLPPDAPCYHYDEKSQRYHCFYGDPKEIVSLIGMDAIANGIILHGKTVSDVANAWFDKSHVYHIRDKRITHAYPDQPYLFVANITKYYHLQAPDPLPTSVRTHNLDTSGKFNALLWPPRMMPKHNYSYALLVGCANSLRDAQAYTAAAAYYEITVAVDTYFPSLSSQFIEIARHENYILYQFQRDDAVLRDEVIKNVKFLEDNELDAQGASRVDHFLIVVITKSIYDTRASCIPGAIFQHIMMNSEYQMVFQFAEDEILYTPAYNIAVIGVQESRSPIEIWALFGDAEKNYYAYKSHFSHLSYGTTVYYRTTALDPGSQAVASSLSDVKVVSLSDGTSERWIIGVVDGRRPPPIFFSYTTTYSELRHTFSGTDVAHISLRDFPLTLKGGPGFFLAALLNKVDRDKTKFNSYDIFKGLYLPVDKKAEWFTTQSILDHHFTHVTFNFHPEEITNGTSIFTMYDIPRNYYGPASFPPLTVKRELFYLHRPIAFSDNGDVECGAAGADYDPALTLYTTVSKDDDCYYLSKVVVNQKLSDSAKKRLLYYCAYNRIALSDAINDYNIDSMVSSILGYPMTEYFS